MSVCVWYVFDLDRTLILDRTVHRLAAHFGREPQVMAALSGGEPNAGMEESRRVMRVFAGVPWDSFETVCKNVRLRPGAVALTDRLRAQGHQIAIATAGYAPAAMAAGRMIGADRIAALEPERIDGVVTGRLQASPWVGDCGRPVCKAEVVSRLDRPVVAVGDGANDVCMFQEADFAIAILPAHPAARAHAHAETHRLAEVDALVAGIGPKPMMQPGA